MSRATSAVSSRRLSRFAADLRTVRQDAGQPTFQSMADATFYDSAPALSRAASGTVVPSWNCVLAFLQACGITDLRQIHRWQRRWVALRHDPAVPRRRPPAGAITLEQHAEVAATAAGLPPVVRIALRMPAGLLRTTLGAVLELPDDMAVVGEGESLAPNIGGLAGPGPKVTVIAPARLTTTDFAEARWFSRRARCPLVILLDHHYLAAPTWRTWRLHLHELRATVIDRDSPLSATQLQELVRRTARGAFVVERAKTLAAQPEPEPAAAPEGDWPGRYYLTPREEQVLTLLLEGLSDQQIARRMKISPHTVSDHMKMLRAKSGVSSRVELVVLAARHGFTRQAKRASAAAESA